MNIKTKNALLIIASVLISVAFVNVIFWIFSVKDQALASVFSTMLSASLANQWTWKLAKQKQSSED